ncbi:MAG TPA: hypothetical protein IAA88_07565 [Candidatus Avimuribaculum pullicola]|nr:hypothetical protein [Candidatus Avimuribaculum pullicola]
MDDRIVAVIEPSYYGGSTCEAYYGGSLPPRVTNACGRPHCCRYRAAMV